MNIDAILDKLSDFCINFAVAAFAIAAFQQRTDAATPGIAAILFAIVFASQRRVPK